MQQQFFPTASRPELLVELRLREGASFAATERQVKLLEAALAKDPDIEFFTAYTGAGTPRFYLSIQPNCPTRASPSSSSRRPASSSAKRARPPDGTVRQGRGLARRAGARQRLEFGPPVDADGTIAGYWRTMLGGGPSYEVGLLWAPRRGRPATELPGIVPTYIENGDVVGQQPLFAPTEALDRAAQASAPVKLGTLGGGYSQALAIRNDRIVGWLEPYDVGPRHIARFDPVPPP